MDDPSSPKIRWACGAFGPVPAPRNVAPAPKSLPYGPHTRPGEAKPRDVVKKALSDGIFPCWRRLDQGQQPPHGLSSQSKSVLNACLIWEIPTDSSFSKVAALSLAISLFPWS